MPNEDVNEPDSADEEALRWGEYVVKYFDPQPGDVFVLKGPANDTGAEYRDQMADAIEHAAAQKGIDGEITFIIGPAIHTTIHQISEEGMNRLGYQRTGDPDPIPDDE